MNNLSEQQADSFVFSMMCEVAAELRISKDYFEAQLTLLTEWSEYETSHGDTFVAPEGLKPVMVYRASEQHWEIAHGDKLGMEVTTEAVRRAIQGFDLWELEPLLKRLQQA